MMPLETAMSESVMEILNRRAQSVVRSTRRWQLPGRAY
jgi:hypothetical protein